MLAIVSPVLPLHGTQGTAAGRLHLPLGYNFQEMSNRMEELPGTTPSHGPAGNHQFLLPRRYRLPEQRQTGSITFIGTVSPAGGNLKEPVTESTKR